MVVYYLVMDVQIQKLARPADTISLLDIYRAVEEDTSFLKIDTKTNQIVMLVVTFRQLWINTIIKYKKLPKKK